MIYLDYNATTPVAEEVLEAMLPYFRLYYGNASSRTHLYGWDAREAVEQARGQLADLLSADPREVVFTSGATEAINLALRSLALCALPEKRHFVTVRTEHKAVLDTCAWLEKLFDVELTYLGVDAKGHIDLRDLAKAIRPDTVLVAVMYANNETGLIHPIAEIAELCREKEVLLFCDATQAVGKVEVVPEGLGIDLMACSAHKMYGPKGVGALYVRRGLDLLPQLTGGGQERKRRAGTLNVPGIVGFGKAAELAAGRWRSDGERLKRQRDWLEGTLLERLSGVAVNACREHRLHHVSNLRFSGIEAEDLLLALSTKVALSAGSACNSAEVLPSHVLKAMGLSDEEALASVRFSLGRETRDEDLAKAVDDVVEAVNRLRKG